ncbi:MAG: fibronectin type III domain-containing protein [Candidatus Cloacimonetes bacterium]|nr:fibronectin type III domain-containing protein [Candidatus Cloacimonadota bacterium]
MRLTILLWLFLTVVALNSLVVETASLSDFMFGTTEDTAYDNFYNRVVEGLASPGYNQYAPWDVQTNGFGNFVNASTTQRTNWGEIVDLFLSGLFDETQTLINQYEFPYEVVQFNDTDTGRTFYMLREQLNYSHFDDNGFPDQPEMHQIGSFDFGWGIYLFNPDSNVPLIVNVVHPKDDFISIPVATKAFQLWDARFMMIAGAGREVLWTNVPPYFNSKSLSDPSRNANHVFHVTYQRMCQEIRSTFGRRELSVQIHSFDYTHMGYNHLQISGGGWNYNYPGLPVRDVSGGYLDMINSSPYLVIPANTIGSHEDILVTDYYSVLYDQHGLFFNFGSQFLPISNNINLPGADGNNQVAYTNSGWNKYDVITPFMHIEMEELPSAYPQTMNYYRWFYGFDAINQQWNPQDFWTQALAFYTPWLEHYALILPTVLNLNDDLPPSNPTNLSLVSASYNNIVLEWERSHSYDFETYEIIYATEPIDLINPNYSTITRSNITTLAGQAFTKATITGLQPASQYFFRLRARDYNGLYSQFSNEISIYTGSATIANLRAYGRDSYVDISWLAQYQSNNQGFNIWRAISGTDDYIMIASWETETDLLGSPNNNVSYAFVDNNIENGLIYDYKVASVDSTFNEFIHDFVYSASPQNIYSLIVQNDNGLIYDTVEFGSNPFATDGYDSNFDILKGDNPGGDYIFAMSYHSNWNVNLRNLQRDIYGFFDPDLYLKTYVIRISTNQTNQPITILLSDNFSRNSEKVYLRDATTGNMVDLTQDSFVYQATSAAYRTFTLYWGNLLPNVGITGMNNRFLQAGDSINFNWSVNFPLLVNNFDLYLTNGSNVLSIANGLPVTTTSYNWTVPDNVMMLDANLVVRANIVDGYAYDNYSNFKLGIIPSTVQFSNEAGWHMKSNPLESPNFIGTTLFGQESQLYSYNFNDQSYMEVLSYQFGQGYWLYMPVDYELATTGTIRKLQYEISLQEGWNLIPNVFLSDINIRDFLFLYQDQQFNFVEAMQYNMVERSLYGMNNNRYFLSDFLPSQESLWIYSNITDLVLKIVPFQQNPDYSGYPSLWKTKIIAQQVNFIGDEILIGSWHNTTDEFNRFFDLPKPPKRPETDFYFYIPGNQDAQPFNKLYSKFKTDLNNDLEESRFWDFVIDIDEEIQPIYFRKSDTNLPTNYTVVLLLDGIMEVLSEDEDYVYIPTSTTINGQIMVTNSYGSSTDELIESPLLFSNYPNPFFAGASSRRNTGTNIAFYLHTEERVKLEIFNIRGQRVTTLIDEKMGSGKHIVRWEGNDNRNRTVSSGVYFYRLTTGETKSQIKKMMLLK